MGFTMLITKLIVKDHAAQVFHATQVFCTAQVFRAEQVFHATQVFRVAQVACAKTDILWWHVVGVKNLNHMCN